MATETRIELTSNLEQTLHGRQRLVALFIARRMACPGCPMARFETLADAARHHDMDGEELLDAVRREVANDDPAPPRRPGGGGAPTRKGGAGEGSARQSGRHRASPRRGREESS